MYEYLLILISGFYWQKEVEELRFKLANGSSTSCVSSAQKLREDYIQKLTFLEDQVDFMLGVVTRCSIMVLHVLYL